MSNENVDCVTAVVSFGKMLNKLNTEEQKFVLELMRDNVK